MVQYHVKQLARFPGGARTNAVVGAPVLKLSSAGADRRGGQMHSQASEESEGEAARTFKGAFLREDSAPASDQTIECLQQLHVTSRVSRSAAQSRWRQCR